MLASVILEDNCWCSCRILEAEPGAFGILFIFISSLRMISSNLFRRTAAVLFSTVCLISVLTNTSRAQYLGWDYQEQARTHNTDIQHIVLNISFDQSAKKLIGRVMTTMSMLPGRDSNGDIVFDAIGLTIAAITIAADR